MMPNEIMSELATAALVEALENARKVHTALVGLPSDLAQGLHAPITRIRAVLDDEEKPIFARTFLQDLADLSSALAAATEPEQRQEVIHYDGAVSQCVQTRLTERGERISSVRSTIDALKASAQRTNDLVDAPRILAALGEGRSGPPA